jgi:ATPase subunit of ABC transporter with duplicated ATPase domains
MSTFPTSLTCTSLSFAWPDGTAVFDDLQISFGPGRTGLVGVNGSGKSTLLKLIAGELTPDEGTIRVNGEVGYLPQNVTLDTALRVDEALGIAATRAALHAIETGDAAEEHFEVVGDDWDVEERALAMLGELGLGHVELDRTIGEVSGGESVLLRLAALLLRRPDVLLLDEPTNNLDLYARRRLYAAVEGATARRCSTRSASRRSSWVRANGPPRSPRASTESCTRRSSPRRRNGSTTRWRPYGTTTRSV